MKICWTCQRLFFLFLHLWDSCVISVLKSYIYWLVYAEPSLHSWNKDELTIISYHCYMSTNWVSKYFIENLLIHIFQGDWSIVLHTMPSTTPYLVLASMIDWICKMNSVLSFLFLFYSISNLGHTGADASVRIKVERKHSGPCCSPTGRRFITVLLFLTVKGPPYIIYILLI